MFWAFGICGWIGTGRQGANTHPPQGCVVQKFTSVCVPGAVGLEANGEGEEKRERVRKTLWCWGPSLRYFFLLLSSAIGVWS